MVKEILEMAGIKHRETRFIQPPEETYAVFHDSYINRGADQKNLICEHDYTIELYSYNPDPQIESRIEDLLNERSIEFNKQERYWIESEQLYQVVYEFSAIMKI
ncbi:hypothetical protein [Thomasclavelia cocleata]|uniref:hypothetical protein n=1 Tax=Thomasclavelia cocleata TaxID=69824 RepID=UPI002570AA67|nr:hypothetical protein [Thomasclavelia cocleata]